ncbi:hypothetical protein [Pandoraea pnomenusa]|uniref:hypothetical protein n=1 Tax=Pandoraea pnomenusa TaxID=93220 RepID=UPI00333F57F6
MSDLKTVAFDASQWQLVPKVPTNDMFAAAMMYNEIQEIEDDPDTVENLRIDWNLMLGAAPTPAAQSAGQEPVYQTQRIMGGWDDVTQAEFARTHESRRRIVYAAPVNGSESASLEGLRTALLDGRAVARDAEGWYCHPALPVLDENIDTADFLAPFGIEATWVSMQDSDAGDIERYSGNPDAGCAFWTPAVPVGDGWTILSIHDHEDGPFALFARRAEPEPKRAADAPQVGGDMVDALESVLRDEGFDADAIGEADKEAICRAVLEHAALSPPAKVSGDGLIEQHARDSAELRRLCAARDEARRTAKYWKANHLAGNAEIERLTKLLEAKVGGDERERFEAWFLSEGWSRLHLKVNIGRVAWEAWSAALSADGGEADDLYYVQDTRSFVGNCPMWWGKDFRGYVTRMDEAGKYTRDEAERICKRDTDKMWPCSMIDPLRRPTIDFQHLPPEDERIAAIAAKAKGEAL